MVYEQQRLPHVARQVDTRDVQLVLPYFDGVQCQVEDCAGQRLVMARARASKLDLLDEPMVLSHVDEAYRLLLNSMGELLVVRIERSGERTRLVAKVAHGDHSWQPAVQTILRRSKVLSQSEWERLNKALREYRFWERPTLEEQPKPWKDERGVMRVQPPVFDGVGLSLEGVDSGRHHFVGRLFFKPEPGLKELVSVFRDLASCDADEGE